MLHALVPFLVAVVGCDRGPMVSTTYDTQGHAVHTVYSFIYDAKQILVPDTVGIALAVDQQDKKVIPILYRLQFSLGLLGPDDLSSKGRVITVLRNIAFEPVSLELLAIKLQNETPLATSRQVNLEPKGTELIELGDITIFTYGTELTGEVQYRWQGTTQTKPMTLKRRTMEELEALTNKWRGRDYNVPEYFQEG